MNLRIPLNALGDVYSRVRKVFPVWNEPFTPNELEIRRVFSIVLGVALGVGVTEGFAVGEAVAEGVGVAQPLPTHPPLPLTPLLLPLDEIV